LPQEEFDVILTELQLVIQYIQDLQKRLVEANLLLVASIAKQFTLIESPLSFLDLMQEGSIGLMKAIHKFRLEKGGRFSTYATWWISQAIRRALDEQSQLIRLPGYIIEKRRRAEKVSLDLTKRLGREPRMSELAEAVNIAESKLDTILQAPKALLSLDSPLEESDDRTKIADLIRDNMTMSPEEEILFQARREVMEKLLATLPPQQASVIRLRYGLFDGKAHTLAQIGGKLKITRERVRQIEVEALAKLRHPTRRRYWEELFE
jgi:RNA polymerase primary sigma factor